MFNMSDINLTVNLLCVEYALPRLCMSVRKINLKIAIATQETDRSRRIADFSGP